MAELNEVALGVAVVTLLLLVLFGAMGALLIVNSNRRHRHRAEMAEMRMRRQAELAQAAREATEHTLAEVGRELHDNVGQLLSVAHMGLHARLEHEQQDARVATALGTLEDGIAEVRRLGRTLNKDLWQQRGLIDAIEAEAQRLERLGRAKVLLRSEGTPKDPPTDVRTILFRTFQEVVHNALRHSGAKTMSITITDRGGFTLSISDDGCGFDPQTIPNGSGLVNIRSRCTLIGYDSELDTRPGGGCRWTFKPRST